MAAVLVKPDTTELMVDVWKSRVKMSVVFETNKQWVLHKVAVQIKRIITNLFQTACKIISVVN